MSLKITQHGRKQKQGGKLLGWFPGSVMDIVLHTHLGGTLACGGKEGLLKQEFERLEHPLSRLITSTGKRLLSLLHTALDNIQLSLLIHGG